MVQSLSVLLLLHPVDAHQPVLGSERLLQVPQTDILVADLGVPCPVEPGRRAEVQLRKTVFELKRSRPD